MADNRENYDESEQGLDLDMRSVPDASRVRRRDEAR